MNQADIEKYAFLYFCGEKDRDILLENRKMTFEDLERFSYLTDLFGFQKYRSAGKDLGGGDQIGTSQDLFQDKRGMIDFVERKHRSR